MGKWFSLSDLCEALFRFIESQESLACFFYTIYGLFEAKERGVQFGKSKKLTADQRKELKPKREDGVLVKTLLAEYGLSKSSVYRYLIGLYLNDGMIFFGLWAKNPFTLKQTRKENA